VLARVPLDEGALTGTITEQTVFEKGEFRDCIFVAIGRSSVETRDRLTRDLDGVPGTLAEVALRFCLSHPAVSSVIRNAQSAKRGIEQRSFGCRSVER